MFLILPILEKLGFTWKHEVLCYDKICHIFPYLGVFLIMFLKNRSISFVNFHSYFGLLIRWLLCCTNTQSTNTVKSDWETHFELWSICYKLKREMLLLSVTLFITSLKTVRWVKNMISAVSFRLSFSRGFSLDGWKQNKETQSSSNFLTVLFKIAFMTSLASERVAQNAVMSYFFLNSAATN